MHNKSFTADNRAAIVDGRNIDNEYFGAGGAVMFADLDVLALGDAVRQVSLESLDQHDLGSPCDAPRGIIGGESHQST